MSYKLQCVAMKTEGRIEDCSLVGLVGFLLFSYAALPLSSWIVSCSLCTPITILMTPETFGFLQAARLQALDSFRTGSSNVLLATDVAARGLDIPHVDTVINTTCPRTL